MNANRTTIKWDQVFNNPKGSFANHFESKAKLEKNFDWLTLVGISGLAFVAVITFIATHIATLTISPLTNFISNVLL